MPRLFVAIDVPALVREAVANLCYGVQGAHWVNMPQFHITLEFAGELDEAGAERLADSLALLRGTPFQLCLKGIGFFPPRKPVRVLWVGVSPSPGLAALQRQVRDAARRAGVTGDGRKFSPHITIARFRNPVPQQRVAPFIAAHALFQSDEVTVTDFHLYSSVLTPEGAIHRIEQSYALLG